jgi:hypothetical protein
MTRTALITTVFLATLFAPARPARAAEVSASVSSREVFVDLPFTLQVAIENARDREEPQLPQLIGVNVLGDPSESSSSFTQIINGRMTQRETVTLSYRLVATRAGPFTIGPITVVADGATFRTVPIKMVATTSETGDLLFLEVAAARDTYYLGETIDLTLEIWLKPYHDRRTNLVRDNGQMWQQIDGRASGLGSVCGLRAPHPGPHGTAGRCRRRRPGVLRVHAAHPDHAPAGGGADVRGRPDRRTVSPRAAATTLFLRKRLAGFPDPTGRGHD